MERRNEIVQGDWYLIQLQDNEFIFSSWFHCEKEDINDFYLNEALDYKKTLLAETYIYLLDRSLPVALVSLINDKIEMSNEKQLDYLPEEKTNYKYLPAVKIARLGVCEQYQGNNIGTNLLNMCKKLFVCNNRTGCRFITVDAYNEEKVINFYKKNNFIFLSRRDQKSTTRSMYCDLLPYYGLNYSSSPS